MTALNPAAHTIPEGEELVPKAKAPKATEASIALRQKSIWASLIAAVIAILWTIPTVGLLITSFRPAADIRKSGWWTVWQDPVVHPEQLQAGPLRRDHRSRLLLRELAGDHHPCRGDPDQHRLHGRLRVRLDELPWGGVPLRRGLRASDRPDPGHAGPPADPLRRRRTGGDLLAHLDRAQHLRAPIGDLPAPQLHERAAQGAGRGGPSRRRRAPDHLLQDHDAVDGPGDRGVRDLPVPVGLERPPRRPHVRRQPGGGPA